MKLTISPTGRFQSVNGKECRIWKGVTDKGVAVEMYVAFVQVHKDHDQTEFLRELREVEVERQLVSFDYRLAM